MYNKDNPKVFCGARQFLQDVARMFSVGLKIGISSLTSRMPCSVLLYSLLWLPYIPLPQSQSKNHATLSGLEYLALFPSQNQPNCYKIHNKRPKVEISVFPSDPKRFITGPKYDHCLALSLAHFLFVKSAKAQELSKLLHVFFDINQTKMIFDQDFDAS